MIVVITGPAIADLREIGNVVLGLVEDKITGAAGGQEIVRAALGGDGQVAGRQNRGLPFVDGHVGRRAAAIPIIQLFEFHTEVAHDRQERFLISAP